MDISERKAHVRLRHHQPMPSQYGTWWGHGPEIRGKREYGLVVGRGENAYFAAPTQAILGGTSCWDDRPPKRGKVEGKSLGACLEGKREKAFMPWQERVLRWTEE